MMLSSKHTVASTMNGGEEDKAVGRPILEDVAAEIDGLESMLVSLGSRLASLKKTVRQLKMIEGRRAGCYGRRTRDFLPEMNIWKLNSKSRNEMLLLPKVPSTMCLFLNRSLPVHSYHLC